MTRVSFHPQCRVSSSPSWHLLLRGTGLPHSVATATHSAKFPFRMCSNSRPSCTSTSPPTSLGEFAFRDHGPWLRLHRRAVFAVLHSLAAELTDRAFGSPRPCPSVCVRLRGEWWRGPDVAVGPIQNRGCFRHDASRRWRLGGAWPCRHGRCVLLGIRLITPPSPSIAPSAASLWPRQGLCQGTRPASSGAVQRRSCPDQCLHNKRTPAFQSRRVAGQRRPLSI